MRALDNLGVGLSLLFGCLLLALLAHLYYLICRKRRLQHHSGGLLRLCWRNPPPSTVEPTTPPWSPIAAPTPGEAAILDPEVGGGKGSDAGEETVQAELMRLHHLPGPPRFLFTIKEETREDLESEDGKSSRRRSGTMSLPGGWDRSPPTPPRKLPFPPPPETAYTQGFNPLFESSAAVRTSPPPRFKFLRDAEEKLVRRLMEDARRRAARGSHPSGGGDGDNRGGEREGRYHHQQVLPLCSSPKEEP